MRYLMKQKVLSWGDDFYVKDDTGDRTVATVSKRWFSWTDTYGIEIADGEDPVLILASAVVVDQACHPDDGKRH